MKRPALVAALAVLVVLLGTVDTRSHGVIPDGQQMLSSATALAHGLGIGVSRDMPSAAPRAEDAASRYGMGTSLVEAVFVVLARGLWAASPGASTASLLVLFPILCLSGVAGAVARSAERLSLPPALAFGAGAATVLATPLWGYAGSDYGEPLQALLLALLVLVFLGPPSPRRTFLVGLVSGLAVLAKSVLLLAVLPFAVSCALVKPVKPVKPVNSQLRALAAGLAGPLLLWLAFELVRFGKPFGGYPGEDFSYPFITGLLRLTLLPNKGILWYAPVLLLAPFGLRALIAARRQDALPILGSIAAVFGTAASWWAWDGQAAWGPRLVLTAVPALTLATAYVLRGSPRITVLAAVLVALGICVNAVGALVPFPQVYALATLAAPQPIGDGAAQGTRYEIFRAQDGALVATGPHHLSLSSGWAPLRVASALLAGKLRGRSGAELLAPLRELDPPFAVSLPEDATPSVRAALAPWHWPYVGRAPEPSFDPYARALRDQAVRALERKRPAVASRLLAPVLATPFAGPEDVAIAAEAALTEGRRDEALRILATHAADAHPWLLFLRVGLGDSSQVPAEYRAGFEASVRDARSRGLLVTEWAREARNRPR
ncbi:MAG: hypothetical protein JNK60_06990 [Acidobacteria bacterium]|nr:hypothetical protein [Acidobacteriota bacterium]